MLNTTVVPPGELVYLTLWPDGQAQPSTSTLNAIDGAVTSNMAVVPNGNGWVDAYASNPTQLILDTSGFFAQQVSISGQVLAGSTGLSGATMTLTGSDSASTTIDGNGNYSFAVWSGGSYITDTHLVSRL